MTENGAAPTRGRLFGLFYFTIPAASDIIMGLSMEFHRKSGTKMLQFDEYKVKLNNLAPALEELAQALDLESAERELDMLQAESAADGFWDNLAKAQKVQQRIKNLQDKVDSQNRRQSQWDDLMALCEMGNEFEDASLLPELEEGFARLEADMETARLETLLTGEYDRSNVILTIHPGAGGTEAQDWAQMLFNP